MKSDGIVLRMMYICESKYMHNRNTGEQKKFLNIVDLQVAF